MYARITGDPPVSASQSDVSSEAHDQVRLSTGSGDMNSCPHTRAGSTLPTEKHWRGSWAGEPNFQITLSWWCRESGSCCYRDTSERQGIYRYLTRVVALWRMTANR